MRTIVITLGAALNMYLSATAFASAEGYAGGWLCQRYGVACAPGGGSAAAQLPGGLLTVAALAATLALVWEIGRRRGAG